MATLVDVLRFERENRRRRCLTDLHGLISDLREAAERLEAGKLPQSVPLQQATRIAYDLGELRGLEAAIEFAEDPHAR